MTSERGLTPAHSLYCGWVLGIALRHGLRFVPVMDDAGNYTDRITISLPDATTLTLVIPEPPDGWMLGDEVV